ncbi:predicted protein [Pyrenophora tritici-repentis Pt-1C-BFP]|uniref:Uncharacterized protein n=1 Tax=Pyrenophora tritici-repentis (strain Pt-1C-BFP) TaxID=426418 RepID=B2W7B9_PYRTR|nr:uncharacterized protein PTRG_05707 [Pyrenophora tritici-repentis Pt-1C-BFP]EDU48627.1 predicted protein [Pyrenophora tritici-repentis Pt-1C-BFP]
MIPSQQPATHGLWLPNTEVIQEVQHPCQRACPAAAERGKFDTVCVRPLPGRSTVCADPGSGLTAHVTIPALTGPSLNVQHVPGAPWRGPWGARRRTPWPFVLPSCLTNLRLRPYWKIQPPFRAPKRRHCGALAGTALDAPVRHATTLAHILLAATHKQDTPCTAWEATRDLRQIEPNCIIEHATVWVCTPIVPSPRPVPAQTTLNHDSLSDNWIDANISVLHRPR